MNGDKIGIGVIGLGHWGPNHVRVFQQCSGARVVACADPAEDRRTHIAGLFRDVAVTADAEGVFRNRDIDAVVIATPTKTHHELAKSALLNGKHIILEKPMCSTVEEAEELLELSRRGGTVLMHGHVFVYNPAAGALRESLRAGEFGRIQYLHAHRTNLGPIRCDVNVVWDLAAHEITIFDYLLGGLPRWVSAAGSRPLGTPREDVAFVTLEYPGGVLAHILVSWLHPQKIRKITLVGDKRMVTWSDTNPFEPLRIYDKGVAEEPYYDSFGDFHLRLREADIRIPKVALREPLQLQAEAFVRRIREGTPSCSEAETGVRAVHCLAAIQKSLEGAGQRIYLRPGGRHD